MTTKLNKYQTKDVVPGCSFLSLKRLLVPIYPTSCQDGEDTIDGEVIVVEVRENLMP